jgi:hypothetical protein
MADNARETAWFFAWQFESPSPVTYPPGKLLSSCNPLQDDNDEPVQISS